jgi:5-(carboxyamino)imidazole ribonucleotide synthase
MQWNYICNMKKIGILGGGQLGRMLLQAAINYPVETYVMENDSNCPAAHLCNHFVQGDITNYQAVYNFGKQLDAITIEIEHVNEDALAQLEAEGVQVFPSAAALKIIKNKIAQKEFYQLHSIPSSEFIVTQTIAELQQHLNFLPAVHKLNAGGYDGRGVQVIKSASDTEKGFDAAAVLEKLVDIKKEIAIIVAVNSKNETAIYPAVEMIVNKDLNQLDYQLCPADIAEKTLWTAEAIALRVVKELKSQGIFAVELFVDTNNVVWVNETAPRVHNSGHHTIEGNFSSQFDMLWRVMLDYPLGSTEILFPSALINIVGEANYTGPAKFEGLEDILKIENAFVHLYGKSTTKPGRKMGHVTIISKEKQELIHQAQRVRHGLKVVS